MSTDLRKGRHCVYQMHIHLVFVTKYRRKIFTQKILEHLESVFSNVCEDFEASLEEFNGERNHVHLLIYYPPKISVSKLVNSLKGVSSRLLRKSKYPSVEKSLWKGALWSPSYFAGSCGGASIEVLTQYIKNQNRPD